MKNLLIKAKDNKKAIVIAACAVVVIGSIVLRFLYDWFLPEVEDIDLSE